MAKRLTEQAYIKGLNQGYALAKAQYSEKPFGFYTYMGDGIVCCSECEVQFHKPDIQKFCPNCGVEIKYINKGGSQ